MAVRPRVLLVDDHPLVREVIRSGLSAEFPDLLVEDAPDIRAALSAVRYDVPTLVLLDYQLPDSGGFAGFVRLRNALRGVPIAIISAHDHEHVIQAARALGAAGFISKRSALPEIVAAVRGLLNRLQYFPDVSRSELLDGLAENFHALSPAQKQVLAGMVRGNLNKQIASELDVAEATIKTHLTQIFRKLGVAGRMEAVLHIKPLLDPHIEEF